MNYWLVKSEPAAWSFDDQLKAPRQTTHWNGVRNYQASNNLKAMKKGDRAFFYHSVTGKAIVGIVEVVKEYYPDPSDKTGKGFGMVDFKAVEPFKTSVTLQQIKDDAKLAELPLVKQSRLSVMPIDAASWRKICKMGGLSA